MKTKNFIPLILLIFLLIVVNSIKAQDNNYWPHKGAKWHYCISTQGEDVASELWMVIGDTTINEMDYSIISNIKNKRNEYIITRYDNDTIYRYVNNKEYMFFTFNLEEGDVFTTFRSAGWNSWNDSTLTSLLPLKVMEKNTINYDGTEYNRFLLYDTLFSHLYGIEQRVIYELVEPIGVINSYPFINVQESTGGGLISDYDSQEIFLYEDEGNSISISECKPTQVNEKLQSTSFDVSPNPMNDSFCIIINDDELYGSTMTIYSVNGVKITEINIDKKVNRINMTDYPNGVYFIVMDNISMNKIIRRIIKM